MNTIANTNNNTNCNNSDTNTDADINISISVHTKLTNIHRINNPNMNTSTGISTKICNDTGAHTNTANRIIHTDTNANINMNIKTTKKSNRQIVRRYR